MVERNRIALQYIQTKDGQLVNQEGKPFDVQGYSRFKHGSALEGQQWGYDLADLVADRYAELLTEGPEIVITSASYKYLPTASEAIATSMRDELNIHLAGQQREPALLIKKHKDQVGAVDYSAFTTEQREELMRSHRPYIDPNILEGKHLFVVDDIRITGGAEDKTAELVQDLGQLSVWYFYAAILNEKEAAADPTIETRMNQAYVKNLDHVAEIVATRNFVLNARTCKFILGWEKKDELQTFFEGVDDDFLKSIYKGTMGSGYKFIDRYEESVQTLENVLTEREILSDGRLRR